MKKIIILIFTIALILFSYSLFYDFSNTLIILLVSSINAKNIVQLKATIENSSVGIENVNLCDDLTRICSHSSVSNPIVNVSDRKGNSLLICVMDRFSAEKEMRVCHCLISLVSLINSRASLKISSPAENVWHTSTVSWPLNDHQRS